MGWGDYIITAGLVRKFKTHNPNLQILVKEPFNETIYYKDIFYKNPYITHKESFDEKKPHIKMTGSQIMSSKCHRMSNKSHTNVMCKSYGKTNTSYTNAS